jgi:hypothetical protein
MNGWLTRLYLSLHRMPAVTAAVAIIGAMIVTAVALHSGTTSNGFVWGGPR